MCKYMGDMLGPFGLQLHFLHLRYLPKGASFSIIDHSLILIYFLRNSLSVSKHTLEAQNSLPSYKLNTLKATWTIPSLHVHTM